MYSIEKDNFTEIQNVSSSELLRNRRSVSPSPSEKSITVSPTGTHVMGGVGWGLLNLSLYESNVQNISTAQLVFLVDKKSKTVTPN
jgi:hypothetical protein